MEVINHGRIAVKECIAEMRSSGCWGEVVATMSCTYHTLKELLMVHSGVCGSRGHHVVAVSRRLHFVLALSLVFAIFVLREGFLACSDCGHDVGEGNNNLILIACIQPLLSCFGRLTNMT